MDDDLTLLASAYLDGDVTPDERARVEGDPSLVNEVERLRAARAALLDPDHFPRPPDAARERAIAAALAAGVHSPVASGAPTAAHRPRVLRFERRRVASRVLAVAAAAVALAGFGVVVTQLDGGDDESDSAAFDAPAATMAAEETLAAGAEPAPDDTMVPMLAADATAGADATTESESDSDATARADAASEGASGTQPTADIAAPPAVSLESPADLAAFAADAATALDEQDFEPLTPPCDSASVDDVEFVATGTYRGQPVFVGTDGDRAIAVDPDSCEIVAEARLP